ncbi:MAG: hypothetical protein H7242_00810, partial [Microbacteriaceae bacterium]|nr:hypothetical protein [Burkholderiaceae bacterium]
RIHAPDHDGSGSERHVAGLFASAGHERAFAAAGAAGAGAAVADRRTLGLHQAQTRSWPAWYHHVALTRMAMHFMLEAQLEGDPAIPYLSFASIKLLLARKLRNKLDQNDALQSATIKRTKRLQRPDQRPNPPT